MDPFEELELIYRARLIETSTGTDADIRRAVHSGELQRVVRGVLMPPDPTLTPEQHYLRRVVGTCRRTKGGRVLSHQSAALLHGLDMSGRAYRHVHYIVERGAEITAGVYKHHGILRDHEIVQVGPIRVTSMARTAADLACAGDFSSALVVLDCALRKGVSRDELEDLAERLSGSPGISTFRGALRYADGLWGERRRIREPGRDDRDGRYPATASATRVPSGRRDVPRAPTGRSLRAPTSIGKPE
jgi:hypothetical protein